MSQRDASPYDQDLGRNPANHQPLTPLTLLERAVAVWPERTAVIHGRQTHSYHELYARCRRLASALSQHGIGPGDTVSAMLPNVPSMIEAHFGVAMTGAVLHPINTRLDGIIEPTITGFLMKPRRNCQRGLGARRSWRRLLRAFKWRADVAFKRRLPSNGAPAFANGGALGKPNRCCSSRPDLPKGSSCRTAASKCFVPPRAFREAR